ncbi:MAG: hypothetical protein WAU39_12345 [Polyangiales bacterium]
MILVLACGGETGEAGSGGNGGDGGTAATGGRGGTGGAGGASGAGGAPSEPGLYVMDCSVAIDTSNRIPFPVEFNLHADVDPTVTVGGASTLATSVVVRIAPDFEIAPFSDAVYSSAELLLTVQGAEPTEIVHALASETSVYAPFLETDARMTEITHDAVSDKVTVEIAQFSVTITGLPEELYPGGELIFPNEDFECGDIVLRDGSSVITFLVSP